MDWLALGHVRAPEHDVRAAEERVDPDRVLQRRDRVIPPLLSRVGLAEPIVRHGVERTDLDRLPEEAQRPRPAWRDRRQAVPAGRAPAAPGIERECAAQLHAGRFVELEADHELRGVEVRRDRGGRDAEGLGNHRPRLVRLPGLDVRQAEHVAQFAVVPRPLPRLLQQRKRLAQPAGKVVREAEHLDGLTALERTGREASARPAPGTSMART